MAPRRVARAVDHVQRRQAGRRPALRVTVIQASKDTYFRRSRLLTSALLVARWARRRCTPREKSNCARDLCRPRRAAPYAFYCRRHEVSRRKRGSQKAGWA
eukprot:4331387-Pleurochrysis_carterae.AAC.1